MSANRNKVRLFLDVRRLIEELRPEFSLGIVSNNSKEIINRFLEAEGLLHAFRCVVGGGKYPKPHTAPLLKCYRRMGLDAENIAYIGDMEGDIIVGKAAGSALVIGVSWGFHSKERLLRLGADSIADNPLRIKEIIKEYNNKV